MDRKLHLLDSFIAQGDDGVTYKVMAYEHLVRNAALPEGRDLWEATGQLEYRLASGEVVEFASDGAMRLVRSGVSLRRPEATLPPAAQRAAKARRSGASASH